LLNTETLCAMQQFEGGGYRPQVRRFQLGDYVYLQQTAPTTLDVTTGRIILRVREVLGSGVLLLEGRDSKFWKDHTRNCALCHLPHIDGTVHPGTSHISAGLKCQLCGSLWEHGFLFFFFRLQTSVKTGSLKCSNK
jgi:hypothetical protein